MCPFLPKPTKRIFRASSPVAASLATFCSLSLLAGGAVTLTTLLAAPAASAAGNTDVLAMRGEIVIWVPAGIGPARVAQLADAAQCNVVGAIAGSPSYYLLRLKSVAAPVTVTRGRIQATTMRGRAGTPPDHISEAPTSETLVAITALKAAQPDMLADPNYIRMTSRQTGISVGNVTTLPTITPNDPFFGDQWDKRMINMPQAWNLQTSSLPVIVADIDNGFEIGHPDFFRNGSPVYIDPVSTSDSSIFATGAANVASSDGHGVHTAGTISAVANNGIGVTGVAGYDGFGVNIKLFPIKASSIITVIDNTGKVIGSYEGFTDGSLIAAVNLAVSKGCVAINMSLGGTGISAPLQQVVENAIASGTLVVAANGNRGVDANIFPEYPANYPSVIAVSALNSQAQLASYSNYGGNTTIAAPGGDLAINYDNPVVAAATRILSTFPVSGTTIAGAALVKSPGYAWAQGTSMACPQVTGAVALLAAAGATAAEIPGLLTGSATPLPDPNRIGTGSIPVTSQSAYGAGLLNVANALLPKMSLIGGTPVGIASLGTSGVTDLGTTYFRSQPIVARITGVGNVARAIAADPNINSLSLQIQQATTPSTSLISVNQASNTFPKPNPGESPFTTKTFTIPAPLIRLQANRYKALVSLNYRGAVISQTQFFEVLDYNQPIGLTLFSVPFKPASNGVTPEQQVLGVSNGFSVNRFDPLNPLGSAGVGYFRYQPGDGGVDESYARFNNQTHSSDKLHPNRPPVPLAFSTGDPTTSIAPIGVGYWMNISDTRLLETSGTPATDPVAIPLFGVQDDQGNFRDVAGWNLIGAPFGFPVNWGAVTVRQQTPVGTRDYTLRQAIDAQIINAQLVGWDVPTRNYFYSIAPDGQLLPFHAYWVRALQDCTIVVPPTRATATLQSRAVATNAPSLAGAGWRVRLSASVAGDRDAENYFGQVRGANDGEDKFDVQKPPTGPSHADVRFLGTDKRGRKAAYAFDMRPLTAGRQKAEWTVAVGAGKGNTDVVMTWDGMRNLPSRARLTLHDTVSGKTISMNGQSSYTYKNVEAGATRLFTVSLSPGNSGGPLQIRNIRAVSVGGGRAQQHGVNVRFALSQDAEVQATVQTLSGKVVNVLNGPTRAVASGDVLLQWDGRSREGSGVPSGAYVLEITARTDSGEVTTVKRPITYLQ